MKITVQETTIKTFIEGGVEELRASNSVADSFSNMFRRVFNNIGVVTTDPEDPDDEEEKEED